MEVVGVRVEMPTNQPIVLLKETQGERYLPIWIGPMEATAIAYAQQGLVPVRPLTHDLLRDILEALDVQLRTVNITALRNGTFFADLIFSNGKEVSARPSDSIALALRTGATIFAAEEILEEAGIVCRRVNKVREGRPHVVDMIKNDEIDLIVNTTEGKQAIRESKLVWEPHPELWPRPIQAMLHVVQAIVEALTLGSLGLDAITTVGQAIALLIGPVVLGRLSTLPDFDYRECARAAVDGFLHVQCGADDPVSEPRNESAGA